MVGSDVLRELRVASLQRVNVYTTERVVWRNRLLRRKSPSKLLEEFMIFSACFPIDSCGKSAEKVTW